MNRTASGTEGSSTRNQILAALGAATAIALATVAPAAATHGPASDEARCVGEFASTGGTQLGPGFGVLISGRGAMPRPDQFGRTIVSLEARSEQGACPIDPDLFFPPEP